MRSSILHPRSAVITSRQNPLVKFARALRLKKHRDESGCFFCEGTRVVDELLKSDWEVQHLLVTPRTHDAFAGRAGERGTAVGLISDELADYVGDAESSQGTIAVARTRYLPISALVRPMGRRTQHSALCVLDRVSDPGNVGAIIRMALAFDSAAVVLLEACADPFNPKTVRATAGSMFHLPLVTSTVSEFLTRKDEEQWRLVVAAAHDGQPPWEVDLSGRVAIAVGSEAHGVSAPLNDAADELVTIPLSTRAESLNVATAAAVILAETARQQWKARGRQW